MKKNSIFSKVTAIVLTLAFVIIPFPVNAISIEEEVEISTIDVVEVINRYKTEPDIVYTVYGQKSLKSFSGDDRYTYYKLLPYGYAIIYTQTGSLMEASYNEGTDLIDISDQSTYYYGGPNMYCKAEYDNIVNILTNKKLNDSAINAIAEAEQLVASYELNKNISVNTSINNTNRAIYNSATDSDYTVVQVNNTEYLYFSNLTKYGENVNGTCKMISTAILLGYYDKFYNDGFVDTVYRDGDGTNEAFHSLICNYFDEADTSNDIYGDEMLQGINDYLHDQEIHAEAVRGLTNNSAVLLALAELQNGKPIIIGTGSGDEIGYNHSMVAYSMVYNRYDMLNDAMFICNMGWGDYDIPVGTGTVSALEYVLNASWVISCHSINTNLDEEHTFSVWRDSDSSCHKRTCLDCGYEQYENHYDYWDSYLQKCTRCGRTSPISGVFRKTLDITYD